jgi:hypothetical protein
VFRVSNQLLELIITDVGLEGSMASVGLEKSLLVEVNVVFE